MHVLQRVTLAAALVIGLGTWAAADDRITVMTRNGEKLSGRYDGFANNQFYLDTDSEDRKIPLGDIALIDLVGGASGLPDNETRDAGGGSHLLVMKTGAMTKGHLVRFEGSRVNEGSDVAYVVFRTDSGEERRVAMRDVGRLYLGNFPGAPSQSTSNQPSPSNPSTPSQGGETTVNVPANQQWTDTGLTVRQGQALSITANGEITLSNDANYKAGASGAFNQQRGGNGYPMPGTLAGALIGRIGNGRPFGIGAGPANINAPGTGRLYLGINDDVVTDNAGQFSVRISGAGTGSGFSNDNNNGRTRDRNTRDRDNQDDRSNSGRRRRP
jgi:hypothetical protein